MILRVRRNFFEITTFPNIEPDETLHDLFDLSTGSAETASECDSSDPAAEVLMVDGPCSPPGFRREDGEGAG